MGKYVKTLVVKRQVAGLAAHGDSADYSEILEEIERATEVVSERPSTVVARAARRSRSPLSRTRNRCLRELKSIFNTYLSGDYERDGNSAVTLGQIKIIGELVDEDNRATF